MLELPDEEDDGVFGRSCKLYWGCHDEESMPWKDRMEDWDKRGVEVVPVLSQPSKRNSCMMCCCCGYVRAQVPCVRNCRAFLCLPACLPAGLFVWQGRALYVFLESRATAEHVANLYRCR